jgi:hypothetical protein
VRSVALDADQALLPPVRSARRAQKPETQAVAIHRQAKVCVEDPSRVIVPVVQQTG